MAKKKTTSIQRLASEAATRLENLENLQGQVQALQTPSAAQFTPSPMDVRDPITGLTSAQTAARANAQQTATQLGANVSSRTGMISQPTGTVFDPKTGKFVTPTRVGTGSSTTDLAAQQAAQAAAEAKLATRQSAYDLLFEQFNKYGLGSLVEGIKGLITSNVPPSEFAIRLRETDAYKKRFAANAQRIARGLRAIDEATYIGLEDAYQEIMRNYGLPQSYYARGEMGRQEGFEKFIAADVSAPELEDRIQTAYNRVINANPEVSQALRQFYPDITNGDILAYALDPDQALTQIKRKVTAAEIGGAAMAQGLATGLARAEELQRYGVTGAQAREGFQTVAAVTPRATTLSQIYGKQGMGPYTQTTAEQEIFGLAGSAEAERQRRKLTELEQASFAGSSGMAGGALARERAGSI